MPRRRNPDLLTYLVLGGAAVGGYLWWRGRQAAATEPAVTPNGPPPHEPPASQAPTCGAHPLPEPQAGGQWVCVGRRGEYQWQFQQDKKPLTAVLKKTGPRQFLLGADPFVVLPGSRIKVGPGGGVYETLGAAPYITLPGARLEVSSKGGLYETLGR